MAKMQASQKLLAEYSLVRNCRLAQMRLTDHKIDATDDSSVSQGDLV
jgi:hypothetical protein